jgi:pimeloyl-ACP methyl ester carboxylesterase
MSAPSQRAARTVPQYFGSAEHRLFGVYHPPAGAAFREAGVVLCYPGPQEYRHTHWAFRKLAGMLAREGFHVMRFDYSCTGDSAGDSADASIAQWTEDVLTAVEELREVADVSRVSLAGMRLGGALAAAASARTRVRDLVLWDLVVAGRDYVGELDAVQRAWLRGLHFPQDDRREPDELLGYPFPHALRAETAAIDLLQTRPGARRALVVTAEGGAATYDALCEHVTAAGVPCRFARVAGDPTLYDGPEPIGDTLLAHQVPATIVEFLAEAGA